MPLNEIMAIDLDKLFLSILRVFLREDLLKDVRMFVEQPENRIIIEPVEERTRSSSHFSVLGLEEAVVSLEHIDHINQIDHIDHINQIDHIDQKPTIQVDNLKRPLRKCKETIKSYDETDEWNSLQVTERGMKAIQVSTSSKDGETRKKRGRPRKSGTNLPENRPDQRLHMEEYFNHDDIDTGESNQDDWPTCNPTSDVAEDRTSTEIPKIKTEPEFYQTEEWMQERRKAIQNKEPPNIEDIVYLDDVVDDFRRTQNMDPTPFKCSLCPYEGKTKYQLKLHTRSHTGERPLKCRRGCDRYFTLSSGRLRHEWSHGEGRPCPICNKKIKDIRGHVRVVHDKAICRRCDKIYPSQKALWRHINRVHSKTETGPTNLDPISSL